MDRSKLKLHPGSEWHEGTVVDEDSVNILVVSVPDQPVAPFLSVTKGDDSITLYAVDALAVIRAAGLDEELNAAHETIRQLRQESDDLHHQIDALRAESNADFALEK